MTLYKKGISLRKIFAHIALVTSVGTYTKPTTNTAYETLKSNFERMGVLNEKGVKISLDKGTAVKDNEGTEHVLDYNCVLELNNANVTAENIAAFEAFEGKECYFLFEYDDGDVKIIKSVTPYIKEEDISGEVGSMLITVSKACTKKSDFRDFFNKSTLTT